MNGTDKLSNILFLHDIRQVSSKLDLRKDFTISVQEHSFLIFLLMIFNFRKMVQAGIIAYWIDSKKNWQNIMTDSFEI